EGNRTAAESHPPGRPCQAHGRTKRNHCLGYGRFPIRAGVANGGRKTAEPPRQELAPLCFQPRKLPKSASAPRADPFAENQDSLQLARLTFPDNLTSELRSWLRIAGGNGPSPEATVFSRSYSLSVTLQPTFCARSWSALMRKKPLRIVSKEKMVC